MTLSDKEVDVSDVNHSEDAGENEKPLTFLEILGSTFAAAVGVQSKKNRARDFSRGKPLHFIMAGVVFAALFVIVLVLTVRLVLALI